MGRNWTDWTELFKPVQHVPLVQPVQLVPPVQSFLKLMTWKKNSKHLLSLSILLIGNGLINR